MERRTLTRGSLELIHSHIKHVRALAEQAGDVSLIQHVCALEDLTRPVNETPFTLKPTLSLAKAEDEEPTSEISYDDVHSILGAL